MRRRQSAGREYPCFAPVALAGIGDLPETILDRAIVVVMKRRRPDEHVEQFRERHARRVLDPIRERLERWAEATVDELREYEPDMPDGLTDRPADVWEPLVMLGDWAGPEWSERLRAAAVELNRLRQARDPSLGVRLLADTRTVFMAADAQRLATEELLEQLCRLDEAPWADLRGGL